jgi:hypothetical protein
MTPTEAPVARCAAHPSRLSVSTCQTCARPRCAADVAAWPGGCSVCQGATRARPTRARRRAENRELLLRATLAANATSLAMGYVVAEYVQADLFKWLAPLVLGVLTGLAATSASGNPRDGLLARRVRLVSGIYSLLGTAYGFVLEGTFTALSASTDVLIPYLIAVGAAWAWTTPPKRKKTPAAP